MDDGDVEFGVRDRVRVFDDVVRVVPNVSQYQISSTKQRVYCRF